MNPQHKSPIKSTTPSPVPKQEDLQDTWLTPPRFAAFLTLLIFATFSGVLLGKHTFVYRDFGQFGYPLAHFQRECFWSGAVPLWNPYSSCGLPFLAQWNTLCLYPPSLIYLLLPLTWSLPFFCILHLFWGGLGMHLLASAWTENRLAGAMAGFVFAFNGLMLNSLIWPSQIATFAWMPWVIWAVPEGWRFGGRKMVVGVVVGSMQMLAGGPETIALTWFVLVTLASLGWISPGAPKKAIAVRFVGTALLVAIVCSAQLLPFLELLAHSQRDYRYGASGWEMPLWGWAAFLVPLFRTSSTVQGIYFQPDQYWTSSYYCGAVTLFLGAVAVKRARSARTYLLVSLVGLALLLAFGNKSPLWQFLYRHISLVGFVRYPVKYVVLIAALLPLLGGIGFARLAVNERRFQRFEWITLGSLFCAILLLSVHPSASEGGAPAMSNGILRLAFLVISIAMMFVWVRYARCRTALLGLSLLVVSYLDFITHVPWQNPTTDPYVYRSGWTRTNLNWINEPQLGHSRVMISPEASETLKHARTQYPESYLLERLAMAGNCNLLDNIPQAHSFFALSPAEINDATTLPYVFTNHSFPALLDFMGVSKITAPGSRIDWISRPSAMPHVTAGQQVAFVDDKTAINSFLVTNIDFREIVLLPLQAREQVHGTNRTNAEVTSRFSLDSTSISIRSAAPTIAVIAQTYYPAWKAYLDGKRVKLWRANFAFQAVEVPAGSHEIELVFEDTRFRAGAFLSAIGLVTCLFIWLRAAPIRKTSV